MSNLATITNNILADSGIDDINVIVSTGSYADPAWITSLAWTKITGAPANIVTGTGTTNYLPKFTGASTIGNSVIQEASGFIGIGVSPSSNIDILGSSSRLRLDGTSSSFQILSRNTANSTTNPIIFDADTYTYNRGGVFRMLLDSSGNLGLGVTPSAWSASWTAQQFGQAGSLFAFKSGSNYTVLSNNSYAIGGGYQSGDARYINNGLSTAYIQNNSGQHLWMTAPSGTAGNAISFTQAMTLDASGNLGIGIPNPSNRLQITAAAGSSHARWTESATTVGFVGGAQGIITGHNGKFAVRAESGLVLSGSGNSADVVIASGGAATFSSSVTASRYTSIGSSSYTNDFVNTNIGTVGQTVGIRFGYDGSTYNKGAVYFISKSANGVGDLIFALNNSESSANVSTSDERMRLTSSGNLGLGVTPSAWDAGFTVAQIGTGGSVYSANSNRNIYLATNAFFSSGFKYVASDFAGITGWEDGSYVWLTAPSGTAGNAISFTQAMTLDASGRLGIGVTNMSSYNAGGNHFVIGGGEFRGLTIAATTEGNIYFADGTTGADSYRGTIGYNHTSNYLYFFSDGSERMRITSGGNVLIGTTTDAGFKLQVNGEGSFYQSATNSTAYLRVENNRSRNAALRLSTTVGDYLVGVGIGADVNQFQIYDNVAGATRLTISSTGAATFSSSVTAGGNILGASIIMTPVTANPSSTAPALYQPATGELGINVNGGERMRIFSDGNVFIGSSPSNAGFKLDVNGTGRFSGNVTVVSSSSSTSIGTTGQIQITSSTGLAAPAGDIYLQSVIDSATPGDRGTAFVVQTGRTSGIAERFRIASTGAATFSSSVTAGGNLYVSGGTNTNVGNGIHAYYESNYAQVQLNGATGSLIDFSTSGTDYIGRILFTNATSAMQFFTNTTGNPVLTLTTTGAATFSSSVTAASFIPSGSTIPTNGMYLPSANTIAFSTNTTQRISVSSAGEVQLKQSSNSAQNSVIFNTTIQNAMTLNSSGFLILNGTTGSSRITCYGDGYFSGGIQTGNPYGSTSANWLLGRFLTETTSANGSIRVQIGSKYYNIAAEDLGTVPT